MLRTLTVKTDNCWKASQLYNVYFNNQAKNLVKKNGTGSRFGRKIGRDGGIEKKKKTGKRDWRTPIVDPQTMLLSSFGGNQQNASNRPL